VRESPDKLPRFSERRGQYSLGTKGASLPYRKIVSSPQEAYVLSLVRQAGQISRPDLSRITGLSKTAVTARLTTLARLGLVEDARSGQSSGGRPAGLVQFAKNAGRLVGVDLGASSVDIAVTNLNAELLVHLSREVDVRLGPVPVLTEVESLIGNALAKVPQSRRQLKGIGMGLPGPVEFAMGRPVAPPIMPGWDLFPVREYLESAFQCPVYVDNDVNIMALGERWSGIGKHADNFIFVKLGSGIGCGIICGGEIYRGEDGAAGDIGHIAVDGNSAVCRCGQLGCLETIAGGQGLGQVAEQLVRRGGNSELESRLAEGQSFGAADLAVLLRAADPAASRAVVKAGNAVGHVLAGLVNFYNPSLIVIGGGVAKLGDLLLASIREIIYHRSLPLATRGISIQLSSLGDDGGVIGAAALVLGELYQLSPLSL